MSRIFAVLTFLFVIGCTKHRNEISDQVLVQVNSRTMTARTFADELARRLRVYDALTVKDETHLKKVKEDIIRDFIIQSLVEDYARDNNLMVKKEDLDNEINSVRSNYPDDETFRNSLAEQNLDFKDWTEKLRGSLLNRFLVAHLGKNLQAPTNDEMQAYYKNNRAEFQAPEQIRLRQVVLATENDAEAVAAELQHGRPLKDLAEKFSITPDGQKGGDTGWLDRGTLEIFDRAFKMNRGQRSQVLKSDFGYHIYEVLDKRRAQLLTFEEVKGRIRRTLIEKREQAAYTSWLEQQLRKAHVSRDDEFIAKMKVETKGED